MTLERLTVRDGARVDGGVRHTVTRSVTSYPHGNCVYLNLTNVGDPHTLAPCNHSLASNEIHDCRGLGDP